MSYHQSKNDKNDADYRKSGQSSSFNQRRNSSGGYGRGGGGPGPSITSTRSFNKKSNHAQGGQPRVNPSPAYSTESNVASAARTIHNGTHVRPQLHGASDRPVTRSPESSAAQWSPRVVPKAPTSQPPPMSSDTAAPTSTAKGDASNAFPFQFGSIVPGVMNGVAIPARTSSAPPNLVEQKREQARHDSYISVPSVPIPPVPKQEQPPRKDLGVAEQSIARESHIGTVAIKDPQVSSLTAVRQMQKPSVVPVTGISMAMPYHQPHPFLQFGGPNPQIQSQSISAPSLPMPMPMPIQIGNAPQVQQPLFVPGLHPHPMHQGQNISFMHQGQTISFNPQPGHQFPHQLGNMSIPIAPQYTQQRGKFTGPRKTTPVKITHPETHEELRLDKRTDAYSDGGSSGARSHPNIPSQSQPVKSIAASHPMNYYPSVSGTKDTTNLEPNKMKTTSKGKKKRKEILQKAGAAGSTSDLYNAYKRPEEKKETSLNSENTEGSSTSGSLKQLPAGTAQSDAEVSEKHGDSKAEPDDWEDTADISTPKLDVGGKPLQVSDGSGGKAKKYSRDFLLKFAEQCAALPEGFEITTNLEPNKMKTTSKGKKKRKEILQKAGVLWDE